MSQLQATSRVLETAAKWVPVCEAMESATAEEGPRAFCKALEFLLERLNTMRIDTANTRLRQIAPVIQTHGLEYERTKFAEKLQSGSLTLERTEVAFLFTIVESFSLSVLA